MKEEDKGFTINSEPGGIAIYPDDADKILEFKTTFGYVSKIRGFLMERSMSNMDTFIHEAIRLHMFRYEIEEGKHGDYKLIVKTKKKD